LFREVDNENHWPAAVIRTATDTGKSSFGWRGKPAKLRAGADNEISPLPETTTSLSGDNASPYVPLTKYETAQDVD